MLWKNEQRHLGLSVFALTTLVVGYTCLAYPSDFTFRLTAATAINLLIVAIIRWRLGLNAQDTWNSENMLLTALSIAVLIQSFESQPLYTLQSPDLDRTPLYLPFLVIFHFIFVSFISMKKDPPGVKTLYGGILFSSVLYLPLFHTPEGSVPFFAPQVLALASMLVIWGKRVPNRPTVAMMPRLAMRALMVVGLAAAGLSYEPQASWLWWFKLLALAALAEACLWMIPDWKTWKGLLFLAVAANVIAPATLGLIKFFEISMVLGLSSAVTSRLNLAEFGRANLVARDLIVGTPALLGFWWASDAKKSKIMLGVGLILAAAVFALCQSWGSVMGAGLAGLAGAALGLRYQWAGLWKRLASSPWKWPIGVGLGVGFAAGASVLFWLGSRVNIGSFNGRLFQFRTAFLQTLDHPWLGVGPGVYHVKALYADRAAWLVDTQLTIDHPLFPVSWYRESTTMHFHNLLMEIGSGMGIPGMLLMLVFLFFLFRLAIGVHAKAEGPQRGLLAMIFAGLVAEAGWGLLDVMQISPPFFSTAVWVLVGLVFAADGLISKDGAWNKPSPLWAVVSWSGWPKAAAAMLAIWLLIVMAGNAAYRQGFAAFQNRDWSRAESAFANSLIWEPWSAKYAQLRGETRINLGRYDEALVDFQRAARLKRSFSPYENTLGWLFWLQGDASQAGLHFQEAVRLDPLEAWKSGLHADLGLLQASAGQNAEAVANFQETAGLNSGQWVDSPWRTILKPGGVFAIVLDPVYTSTPESARSLQARLLAKLGRANYTPRLFDWVEPDSQALPVEAVLDGLNQAYREAFQVGDRRAPALLAAEAETARAVGLLARAERAYRDFQAAFPGSAYGYRELGSLYLEQDRPIEAVGELKKASIVSPQDARTWLALASASVALDDPVAARDALNRAASGRLRKPQLYELQKQIALNWESRAAAAAALRRQLYAQDTDPTVARLELAGLYETLVQPENAAQECQKVANGLLETHAPFLDSHWQELALCVARGSEYQEGDFLASLSQKNEGMGALLRGHVLRAKGELEQAIAAYERAGQLFPADPGPLYFAGELYVALGNNQLAAERFRQASALAPEESIALLALGRLQVSEGRQEEAEQTFLQAARVTPGSYDVQAALGNLLFIRGDHAAAGARYHIAQALMGWREDATYSFVENMAQAEVFTSAPGMVRLETLTIEDISHPALFMHPDSKTLFRIKLPAEPVSFTFAPALLPDSWSQAGDGVLFTVRIEAGGVEKEVYSRYVNPKLEVKDRAWQVEQVDLSAFAGQEVNLILQTGSGPEGDDRFDWSSWGEPYLVKMEQ